MLHSRFQAPEPNGSEEEFFKKYLCISMVQHQDPLAWNQFIPRGHHLNKLGKGLLGHATYKISST